MSDLNLTFTGTSSQPYQVFAGHVNSVSNQGTPPPFQNGNDSLNVFFDPNDRPINWGTAAIINGLSINQVIALNSFKNLPFRFTEILTFTVTSGIQLYQTGRNEIFLLRADGNQLDIQSFILAGVDTGPGTADGTTVYSNSPSFTLTQIIEPPTPSTTLLRGLQLIAYNTSIGVANQPIDGYNLQLTISVTLQIFCMDANLASGFCFNYCQAPTNLSGQSCFDAYRNLCFNDKNSNGEPNITTITACQDYFGEYIQQVNPVDEIDRDLLTYCAKYTGGEDLIRSNNKVDIELCACHLNQTFYDNLQKSLFDQVPAYRGVAEDSRCLFPTCVSSDFKTVATGSRCLLPNCLNVVDITNSGTIDGPVTVSQDAKCASVNGGSGTNPTPTPNPNNPENKSWWDKYWIWIVLGGGLLLVLIIIIIIIVASESKKKKTIYPR
jgi:hypothetical protein